MDRMLRRLVAPNVERAGNVAGTYGDKFARTHAGSALQAHHVGDDLWKLGQRGVDYVVRHWCDGLALPNYADPGSQSFDGQQRLVDADGHELLRRTFRAGFGSHFSSPTVQRSAVRS